MSRRLPDTLSELEKLLIRHEGLKNTVYRCPAGRLTVGVGRNLEDNGITDEEALILLRNDIRRCELALDAALGYWRMLSPPRQRVLISMCFQLGLKGLLGFKRMLAALEDGEYAQAARELLDSKMARQIPLRAKELARLLELGV